MLRLASLSKWMVALFWGATLPLLIAGCNESSVKCTANIPPRDAVEIYDPIRDRWRIGERAPFPLRRPRCAEISAMIYVTEGADLLRYEPIAGTWESLPDIPTPRWEHDVVALGTDLYVLGGTTAAVEVFDSVSETWSLGPEMPGVRAGIRAVELGGSIYAMAPSQGTFELLDPWFRSWQALAPLPQTTSLTGIIGAETDGTWIYLIGGEVWIYNPVADAWGPGPTMPAYGRDLSVDILGQEIFVVGAFGFGRQMVYALDTTTLAWSPRRARNKPYNSPGVVAADGFLYTIGGFALNGCK